MIRQLLALFAFLLLFSVSMPAQKIDSKKYIKKVHKEYTEQLKLNEAQRKEFKKIIEEYNPKIKKLIDQNSSIHKINRMIKTSIAETYKVLNSEQIKKFNEIRLKIEPLKKYRFD
jgi:septal ring factor EnvC (AmiA/AmiB activator)